MRKKEFLLIMLLLLGIGFAGVATTLYLNGDVTISTNNDNFDVIFTKAVIDGTNTPSAIIESGKKITFETKDLVSVGDISKLDFEVTNNSEMYDAEVSINCTATGTNNSYYRITPSGAMTIAGKAKGTGKVEVKLLMASANDIREEFTCTLTATAVERTTKATSPPAATFADDSWATIGEAVKLGTYPYQVGDTKTVDMGSLGTHTLRVANTSPCTAGETSETACGFVLEFVDIITEHEMNSTNTNEGGWESSKMREYVNNDIYSVLPSDLKAVIIDTTVVSDHGYNAGETNFTTIDKLYLLSTKEVSGTSYSSDTVNSETRQLDYYRENGVTSSNLEGAIKKSGSSNSWWWLRSVYSNPYGFYTVTEIGSWGGATAESTTGVAPAFRIA